MATVSDTSIILCWVIFAGYWIIGAFKTKRTVERQSLKSMLVPRGLLALCYILLVSPIKFYPLGLAIGAHTDSMRGFGAVVCVFGLFVAIWSRRTLAGNWSSAVTFKEGHELVETGPYRFARHPIYTGLLLMCLGTAVDAGRVRSWLGFLCMCVALCIKLTLEESLLLRHFPGEYASYQRRVKVLVPFLF
jgi:protein-S-isoprenylcysteine O-methyltransferase Ste14